MTSTPATELLNLKPAQLTAHPDNPRHDLGDLDELAASIKSKGIAEPLVVVPHGAGYRLLMGHRRLAAAKIAKLKELPCIVRHDLDGDDASQIELMLVENLQRTELTPLDEATAYEQLLAFPGYTHQSIASAVGRSKATVTKRVGLTRLGDKAKKALRGGQIGLDQAEKMVVFATDATTSAKLEKAIGTHNFPYALEEARRTRERANKLAHATQLLKKARVRQITIDEYRAADSAARLIDLDITPPDHNECPGHAAYVLDDVWHPGHTEYVCLDVAGQHPAQVGEDDDPEANIVETDEQRADRAAAEAAAAEEEQQLATAARVRRDHLYRVIMGDPDVTPVSALQLMREQILDLGTGGQDLLVDVLGIKADTDTATRAELDTELRAAISRLTLEQLVVAQDVAVSGAIAEQGLARERDAFGHNYVYRDGSKVGYRIVDPAQAWRTRLVDVYGYRWTDVEQAFIDQRAAELDEEIKPYRPTIDAHLPEPDGDTSSDDLDDGDL